MDSASTVSGLTIWYPEQNPENIQPYPWTFHLQGHDNTVENVTLINSYNGIKVGETNNCRHRIRSVYGCVLRRGVYVNGCRDIGRVDNVHFHSCWWADKEVNGNHKLVYKYMSENLEAFIFGKTDWEYCTNTFVFPAKIGYRFIKGGERVRKNNQTEKDHEWDGCNGHFTGIGADATETAILVEWIQPVGLLITGGQFVSFNGPRPIQVVVDEKSKGNIRFVNCSFWGMAHHNAVLNGDSYVSFDSCYFTDLSYRFPDREQHSDKALILAEKGKLQVNNCTFDLARPSIHLNQHVKHAFIQGNNGKNGVTVKNNIGKKAIIINNEPVSGSSETEVSVQPELPKKPG